MPYPPRSPDWCLICHVEAGQARLFAVYVMRPYQDRAGRRHTHSIPARICAGCARQLATDYAVSSGKLRADFLRRPTPRPRVRTSAGTYATREQMTAYAAAGRDR